jgi:hypothetical protein
MPSVILHTENIANRYLLESDDGWVQHAVPETRKTLANSTMQVGEAVLLVSTPAATGIINHRCHFK